MRHRCRERCLGEIEASHVVIGQGVDGIQGLQLEDPLAPATYLAVVYCHDHVRGLDYGPDLAAFSQTEVAYGVGRNGCDKTQALYV